MSFIDLVKHYTCGLTNGMNTITTCAGKSSGPTHQVGLAKLLFNFL